MCSKPCLRDVWSWTPLVLAGVLWCCSLATALHAQGRDVEAKRQVLKALEEAPRYRAAHRLLLKIVGDQKETRPVTERAEPVAGEAQ